MGLTHVYTLYCHRKKHEILQILILKWNTKSFDPITKTIQNNPNNK
jgi:hypothetical protein